MRYEVKKIALITGASSGIGKAISRLLVAQQFRVIGVARNRQKLDALSEELGSYFYPLELDVTDPISVKSLLTQLPDDLRNIDVLVNNAGHDIGGRRHFEKGDAELWCDIVETNVQGVIRVTHAVIQGMLERGQGQVINMGSIAGLKPYATGSAYVTSKYAVHGLSETLRLDYAGRGIRVTEIMPGLVRTDFAHQRLGDEARAEEFYAGFDACLNPEDIAQTVLFALQQPRHVEIAQLVVLPVS